MVSSGGFQAQAAILWSEFSQVPTYHLLLEAFLFLCSAWLLCGRRPSKRSSELKLTKEEEEELLAEWTPEPLVPEVDPDHPALHCPIISGKSGKYLTVNDKRCLDMGTHNYLGFAGNEEIEVAASNTVKKYGVGSCGPRGFYGTTDVHIHTEERLAKFLGVGQACLYSYGFSAVASAIPAYAKRGDIIFADECVNFAIQKGLDASRSQIKFFRHNDPDNLALLLEQQAAMDKKHVKQAKVSRRFLIVEGIYMNSGQICKIREMIELKKKYRLRLFIDESVSFGTLGRNGKGITEHANSSLDDVDLIMASLEYSIGSVGGFVAGTPFLVEHQTLAGLGYCFSASLPPLLATASMRAIDMLDENPTIVEHLHDNCKTAQELFGVLPHMDLHAASLSPIKHLRISEKAKRLLGLDTRSSESAWMKAVVDKARDLGLALTMPAYLEDKEALLPPVSIRVTVSVLLTEEDINWAASTLKSIINDLIGHN